MGLEWISIVRSKHKCISVDSRYGYMQHGLNFTDSLCDVSVDYA